MDKLKSQGSFLGRPALKMNEDLRKINKECYSCN